MSMSNVFLQGKKREILEYCCSRERGTSWSRNRVHYAQELRFFLFFFSQRTIIWRYKMQLTNSILGTMISLAFSISLDMKISGVTLFGGMAD